MIIQDYIEYIFNHKNTLTLYPGTYCAAGYTHNLRLCTPFINSVFSVFETLLVKRRRT